MNDQELAEIERAWTTAADPYRSAIMVFEERGDGVKMHAQVLALIAEVKRLRELLRGQPVGFREDQPTEPGIYWARFSFSGDYAKEGDIQPVLVVRATEFDYSSMTRVETGLEAMIFGWERPCSLDEFSAWGPRIDSGAAR